MPRAAALVFAVAALVAAGAFAYQVVTPAPGPAETVEGGADDAAVRDLARRLDLLEEEVFQPRLAPRDPSALLASLDERVRTLEQRPDAPPPAPGKTGRADAAPATPPAPVDVRTLLDKELLARARGYGGKQAHGLGAPYWREIIARGADDEVLVEAHLQIGYAHRGARQHDQEAVAFEEAMRIAGPDSERGQWANYQIAWSEHFRGDNPAARDRMAEIASSRYTGRNTRGHANLYVAQFSLELNDRERAREALETIRRDFGNSALPMDKWLYERATRMLDGLE